MDRNSILFKVLRKGRSILTRAVATLYGAGITICTKRKKHIFFCGYSESSNLGDMAQISVSFDIFEKHFPDYIVVPCKLTYILMKNSPILSAIGKIKSNMDIFVMESGYNTNDGPQTQMYNKIIETFPDSTYLFLPETVYFKDNEIEQRTSKTFEKCDKIHFFARDPVSFDKAVDLFPSASIKLFPDLVTFLIGRYEYTKKAKNGVLIIKRHDSESLYSIEDFSSKINSTACDTRVNVIDTVLDKSTYLVRRRRNIYIRRIIEEISSYEVVVTDKYHGMIFSLIANTPVVVLGTNNHKLTTGFKWLREAYGENMAFAADMNDAIDYVRSILNNKDVTIPNQPIFYNTYYNELVEEMKIAFNDTEK